MQVTVLVIVSRGRKHITLHASHEQASQALLAFVDEHWLAHVATCSTPPPPDATERIKLFFADINDFYVCGEADVSELSSHVDLAIGD